MLVLSWSQVMYALEIQANKMINSGRVWGTFQQLVGKSQREEGSDIAIITVITGRGREVDQEERGSPRTL